MKIKLVFVALLLLCSGNYLWAQGKGANIPMIGDEAPSFTAETTSGPLHFPDDYGRKWKIIFSHPRDFTPVCSSEILTLAQMQDDFEQLNTKLVVISTDTLVKHYMWKKALEETSYKDKLPVKIKFPLVDDNRLTISKEYGMLHLPISTTKDVRGVFIINPQNKIEAIYFYPMSIGRNMEEIKRTLIALQTAVKGKDHVLIPANWQLGDDVMVPQFPYTQKELQANPELKDSYYNVGSFMWFKKGQLASK
ncbi:MAG TPA: redoxin domain-containing protein [Prolixibacteraceae bacterium]|nr:redoxin domain-containing protein [Prolixibacteraceae bacterium]